MDLAVSCGQLIHMTPREITAHRVTWDMLKQWDMSPEEMFRQAGENSRKELPSVVEPMSDVIKGYIMEEFLETAKVDMDKAMENAEKEIYIISNELRIQGASVVFYTDVLEKFAAEKNSDLVLLPSSIHEWLVLTEASAGNISVLEAMVRDANRQVVLPEEVLSEHVYKYTRRSQMLEIVNPGMD